MFACLYSLSAPQTTLVAVAQDFTPRFETLGAVILLDLAGLSRLFGSPREIGGALRMAMAGAPVRIALAPSQTAAALLALGRPGLTVVSAEEQPAALGPLQVSLLGQLEGLRNGACPNSPCLGASVARPSRASLNAPHVGQMEDVLPYFQSCLERTSEAAAAPHANCALRQAQGAGSVSNGGASWTHPRDTHGAELTKRARRVVPVTKDTEHPHTAAVSAGTRGRSTPRLRSRQAADDVQRLLDVLRRWGIKTLGALAALPAGEVYERLGARGVLWQRLARGEDQGPLVPCVPEDPFEGTLDLEWPIEGLEPLSFVLVRLFEPLAERLERADRGAAILHTHLRLTTREVHARTVQLPAPMRDPKTLRTLVLLDLESNPPSAAIDRVRVLIEPTPAKVLQWTLYERAQASPEQVSTLLARLTALMGEGHVGSPQLVNSWKPGGFEMTPFAPTAPCAPAHRTAPGAPCEPRAPDAPCGPPHRTARDAPCEPPHRTAPDAPCRPGAPDAPGTALRRFRLPIPARVQMQEGRPVRVMIDRRGVTGGAVAQWAGPWRTSGEWWNDAPTSPSCEAWDRDEWDVVLDVGPAYRIFVERSVGQWFIEGVID